jgi:nitrite reductase/ring-hydroxylating ferredoxin subunit
MISSPEDYSSMTDVAVSPGDLVPRLLRGEVFTVRRVLSSTGLHDPILELVFSEIERIAGPRKADRIRSQGLEHLHEHLAIADLVPLLESIRTALRPVQAGHLNSIVSSVLGWESKFYYCSEPILRIHPPYDLVASSPDLLAEFRSHGGGGKLGAHDPHRDSWVNCPRNSINVWIALGRVMVGNGISIWPQHFDSDIDSPQRLRSAPVGHPGKPLNFPLDPGDAVVFHAEHLHGSELNWTNETRFALSYRVTLERPRFPDHSRQVYQDSQLGEEFRWSQESPGPERVDEERPQRGGSRPDHGGGTIEPHSGSLARVTLEDGNTFLAGRYCTHEGADLCGGYLTGRKIVCPKHNLPFDLDGGASPCRSLQRIETKRA